MLNALRASVMLIILAGNAHAGEIFVPPAPQPPPPSTALEPNGETLYAETTTPEMSDSLADAALELMTVLSAIL